MREAIDRNIGVVDETGTVIACSELGLIGEIRKGVISAGVSVQIKPALIMQHTPHLTYLSAPNMQYLLTEQMTLHIIILRSLPLLLTK